MSSILTNSSALTALQNLAATQKSLQTTQNQISTGLKVGSSADNASYWSIASTMKSDNGALGAVKTSLAQSAAMLSFTNSAVNNVISVMNQIKNDLVTAKQPGADLDIAVIDFLARGGDGYPFRGLPFEVLGVSYQQALRDFVAGALEGRIDAASYPEGAESRVRRLR